MAVRAKKVRKWRTLSDCENGTAGVDGKELCGRRPPKAESARRTRKAAGEVGSACEDTLRTGRLAVYLQRVFGFA